MLVFVTGASGFIGSAVVKELISSGHQVLGLARSDASAAAVKAAGAQVLRGSLEDLDILKEGASKSDAVIHTAFVHDFADYAGACATDIQAIKTIGTALLNTQKPFVVSSVMLLTASSHLLNEQSIPDRENPMAAMRVACDDAAFSFASKGVKVSLIRLPTVHGVGDHGFIKQFVLLAKEKGVSGYIGDGTNRWPAVHRLDAAKLYILAMEKGKGGETFLAVGEEGVRIKDVQAAIGKGLGLEVVEISEEEAQKIYGWMAGLIAKDGSASSEWTREKLGWVPKEVGLLEDIEQGHYFEGEAKKLW